MINILKWIFEILGYSIKKLISKNTVGEVFDIHAKTLEKHGYKNSRMNACEYSFGSTLAPNWMDWPMLYKRFYQKI